MISGKEFAEKNFSQIEETKEKLFSTGNEELDNLLTEIYYSGIEDGYDYAQKEFAEKDKMKLSDRLNVKRLERTYKGKKGEEYLKLHLDQTDSDPEVRKKGLKAAAKEGAKSAGKLAAIAVPVSAVALGGLHKSVGGSFKEGAVEGLKAVGVGIAAGAAGSAAGYGVSAIQSRSAAHGNKKADKEIKKTRDQVLVASGKMTKKEFIEKWGGKIDGKKVKGSKNED